MGYHPGKKPHRLSIHDPPFVKETSTRGKQTRKNNKKRIKGIKGIILTVIVSNLCATFRATSDKT